MVSNIIAGVYSNPLRVIAFNTHEGWSRDVTEDIARTIRDLNQHGAALSAAARAFVERVTGQAQQLQFSLRCPGVPSPSALKLNHGMR